MTLEDHIRCRIIELTGLLPCGDQGEHVISTLKKGQIWFVRTRDGIMREACFVGNLPLPFIFPELGQ